MQGPRDARLRAGRVSRVVRHDIRETLYITGRVVARQGVVHTPKRGACRARGGHEGEINWCLGLRRWRALREKVVVPSRAVVLTLIIYRSKSRCRRNQKQLGLRIT